MLSVVMITKNAQRHLEQVLTAVQPICSELIIVDSGSSDRTLEIAAQFGAKITMTPTWPGFGPQQNYALSLATQPWVLVLDADEVVPPELVLDIQRTLSAPNADVYYLKRLSYYCGTLIRHSGWNHDWLPRLFRRGKLQFGNELVHPSTTIQTGSRIAKLNPPFLHFSYYDFDEVIAKMNHYSNLSATMLYQRGKQATLGQAISRSLWMFIKSYFLKLGFLDGKAGLMLAISSMHSVYYKYIKLYHLSQKH